MVSLRKPVQGTWSEYFHQTFSNNRKLSHSFDLNRVFQIFLAIFCISFFSPAHADKDIVRAGDSLQIAVPLVAGVISLIEDDEEGTKQWVEGALWTMLATHSLKHTINAKRPNRHDNKSFPSGHTSAAFQGAAFLQMRYGWKYALPAYAAASFVGYSRVHGEYHHWHDVAAGAALALGIQYAVTEMGMSARNFFVSPVVTDKQVGLSASMTF